MDVNYELNTTEAVCKTATWRVLIGLQQTKYI